MNKGLKVGLQAVIAVAIALVEIIVMKIIWNTVYIFPSSPVIDSMGLGRLLNQFYKIATMILLGWQSLILLIIGIIFTLRNHLRIRKGYTTYNSHRVIMYLFVLIDVAFALLFLSVSNITMEYSIYSLVVPGMLFVTGVIQTLLTTITKLGPNYKTLRLNKRK